MATDVIAMLELLLLSSSYAEKEHGGFGIAKLTQLLTRDFSVN
jgi:hypothetical protein